MRAGEIVGIAGVAGNGQSELLEALAGIRPAIAGGSVRLHGETITGSSIRNPRDMRGLGLAHVPEDRQRVGLVIPFAGPRERHPRLPRRAALQRPASCWTAAPWSTAAARQMGSYDMRPPLPRPARPPTSPAATSRRSCWRARSSANPDLLLVGQPTRGVDIGAIEFIHRRLVALRDAGKAILLVSVELDEILALARPHPRDVRRPYRRRDRRRSGDRAAIGLMMAGIAEEAAD